MTNGIDKKALFKLKSEPYLKPISNLGVGFYNLDENTAILRFQLSNEKGALQIHENNLTAYAYFESSNGSVSDVIELKVEDSKKGIVSLTLDKDFLQASTSTSVTGQVYIAVNNVEGNPEYNEVAVFQEFTFEVADALINKISAPTKIEAIRMFDQLKTRIEEKVRNIEEAISNGSDYVSEMKSVLQNGLETLNNTIESAMSEINDTSELTKSDLNRVKSEATNDINVTTNNAKVSVQDTASTAVNSINERFSDVSKQVDSKMSEFNRTVQTNGFVTPNKLNENLSGLQWQKYRLTDDNGWYQSISNIDLNDENTLMGLKAGNYYFYNSVGIVNGGIMQVLQNQGATVRKIFIYDYKNNDIYVNSYRKLEGRFIGWKKINNSFSDTGWIPLILMNGAQPYDNSAVPKYRLIQNDSVTTLVLKGAVKNITNSPIVVSNLPTNISSLIMDDRSFVQNTSIKSGNASIARWTLKPNGDVELFRTSTGNTTVRESDYFPLDLTIIL
ncbi:BppU family phage baseplate upper protein [Staphylococcus pseudintermedius]|nr:BppU family phage baseplate upper protein [Staphylococcus pseudintermedius]